MQCVNLPCRLITFYQLYLRITIIVYHEILQILPLVILLAMLPSN